MTAIQSCSQKPTIEITPAYITNGYWDQSLSNFFVIQKMKVKKDSVLDITQPGFDQNVANNTDITEKLEEDASFVFLYISQDQKKILGDTIYFDVPNKGNWFVTEASLNKLGPKRNVIGKLSRKTWYKFSQLRGGQRFYVYVYIDEKDKGRLFDQYSSNF
jgi:hypothetical protein